MPTPAAGSVLRAARSRPFRVLGPVPRVRECRRRARGGLHAVELFNASGATQRLRASPLLAIGPSEPGRRCGAAPWSRSRSASALLLELGLDSPTKGAIGTGALLAGFPGLDAPARTRAAWQAAVAPAVGLAAALGVLTGARRPRAVAAMAHRRRPPPATASPSRCGFSIAGLSVALALVICPGPAARPRRHACRHCCYADRRRLAAGRPSRSASGRPATATRREERRSGTRRAARTRCARNLTLRLDQPPATRCASAPPSPPASPSTGCSACTNTASGSR